MSTCIINATSMHRIDLNQDELAPRIQAGPKTDFEEYIKALIDELEKNDRRKEYSFPSSNTEVARQVADLKSDISLWDQATQVIAERFLKEEKQAQEDVKQMKVKLRVGSLVQIFATLNDEDVMIITKVDHNSYLNETTFMEQNGLPISQKVRTQKTAIIYFDEHDQVISAQLSDTNTKISKYWWNDFLETREVNPSEKNTSDAFLAIDNLLNKKLMKKGHKSDYWTIRNAVISYFRTHSSLAIDTLVDDIFNDYTADDDKLDITKFKEEMKKLPSKYKFDSQFEVTISAIKARIVKQINLATNLELKFTGEVPDIENLIKAGEEDGGKKFIKIFSDEGYAQFKS